MGGNAKNRGRISRGELMYEFVQLLRLRSACKRVPQATLITDFKFRGIWSIGYNGPASGENDETACRNEVGTCGCVHGEANALIKLGYVPYSELILVSTQCPCEACAKLIVNSGRIHTVAFLEEYRDGKGQDLLIELLGENNVGELRSDGEFEPRT